MADITITGTAKRSDGTAWAGAVIAFRLANDDGCGVAEAGEDGTFSCDIYTNSSAIEKCFATLPDGSEFSFDLDPAQESQDLKNLVSYDGDKETHLGSDFPSGDGGSTDPDVADETARLALTGLVRGDTRFQVDTGFWYEVIDPSDLSDADSWQGLPKVYEALFVAGDPPNVTVLENSIGAAIDWTLDNAGRYLGVLASGTFPANKTVCFPPGLSTLLENTWNFAVLLTGDEPDEVYLNATQMAGLDTAPVWSNTPLSTVVTLRIEIYP